MAAVALLPVLALAPRFLNGPSKFPLGVGDSIGTMSYVRALCLAPEANRTNPLINYPFGFDSSAYAWWNLLDVVRVRLAAVFDCSTDSLVVIFALTPLLALILNCLSGFIFGFSIRRRNLDGFILAAFGIFTQNILLTTRASLSNNVLFFGLLGLSALATYVYDRRTIWLVIYTCLMSLQIWTNVYMGAGFILVSSVVLLTLALSLDERRATVVILGSAASAISIVIGLLPLLTTQWFLLTGNPLRAFARPVDTQRSSFGEILTSHGLLTVGPIVSIVGILVSIATKRSPLRSLLPLLGVLLIISVNLDANALEPLHRLYRYFFGPLRGTGYFMTFIPMMLAFNFVVVRPNIQIRGGFLFRNPRYIWLTLFLLGAIMSIPRSGLQIHPDLYQSNSFTLLSAPYPDDIPLKGAVFHLPDYTYYVGGGTHAFYGSPGREILLDQMVHGRPIINGRDFLTALRNCDVVYNSTTLFDLEVLSARGGGTVAMRVDELPESQVSRIRRQLAAAGWSRAFQSSGKSFVRLELWLAAEEPEIDLSRACEGSW